MFCFKCNNCCVQLIFDKFIKIKEENENIDNSKNNVECKEPLKLYITPPLIGLNNVGFINSTLQCLSQTEPLTNYFLKETTKKKIDKYIPLSIDIINSNNSNELQLSKEYYELIQNLWSKDKKASFSPNKFMNIIEKMNPTFKLGQPGDYKDFIIFILNQIHKELKKPKELNNNINVIEPLNIYDQKNVLNHFFNDFKKECSIISDIFFGITETTYICLNCKNMYNSQGMETPTSYCYQKFNCLIFPLEEVKNYYNHYPIPLNDCFEYNQKEYYTNCNVCQTNNLKNTSKIYTCSTILILILYRGKENLSNVKLNFSETIDITQFVSIKIKIK